MNMKYENENFIGITRYDGGAIRNNAYLRQVFIMHKGASSSFCIEIVFTTRILFLVRL